MKKKRRCCKYGMSNQIKDHMAGALQERFPLATCA